MERRPKGLAVALAGVLAAAAGCARTPGKPSAPPEASEQPRVLLIGIDGADPLILDRLIREGRLPTFARLRREGASGPLRSREPILSPLVWTTIVTGRTPQDHGILDFVETAPDGQLSPITSVHRKAPALWNVLTAFGKRPGFVGWYASYPAETTGGFQVSDRLGFHQVRSARASAGATFPEGLAAELRQAVGKPVPDVAATRARFLADPAAALTTDGARRVGELAKIHATSEFYRRAAPYLQRRFRTDLLGLYFELVDACGHLFMEDAAPRRPEVQEADFRAFSTTVDRCYESQDEVLADLLTLAGPGTTTLVVSDHGFKSGELRPRTSGRADVGLASLWHRVNGVVFAHGAAVIPGAEVRGATILDVTPTVLSLLSVPLSKELPGKPIQSAFVPGALSIRSVERYAPPPEPKLAGALEPDPEAVEKLRALGYLGAATSSGRRPASANGRTASSYLNEGSVRSLDGDEAGALAAFARAMELDPRNTNAMVFAARIHTHRGRLAEAKPLLDRAFRLSPDNSMVRLQRAFWALQSQKADMAEAELVAAARIDDNLPYLYLLKGRLASQRGRVPEALDNLRRAEGLTDAEGMLADILALRAQLETGLGRTAEAEESLLKLAAMSGNADGVRGDLAMARRDYAGATDAYRRALQAHPDDAGLARKLGQALGGASSPREAEAAFGRSLAAARTDEEREAVYGDLSLLFQKEGQEARAREVLEQGTLALPRSPALWGMLGAAYGRANDLDRAIAAYERSVALGPNALSLKTLAALVFERRQDRPRAVALWKRSLALDPNQPDVQRFLNAFGGS